MDGPPKKPKRLRVRTHATNFTFHGRRYRVSLDAPLTPERARKLAVAVKAFSEKQAEKKPQFVYFLQSEDRIKIGIARNPVRRLLGLQTGNPDKLKLLAVIAGDEDLERAIHQKFESIRILGEWFAKCRELEEFIERAKRCDSVYFNHRENEIQMRISLRPVHPRMKFAIAPRNVVCEEQK